MPDAKDTLVSWLRDAHAMEVAAAKNLKNNVGRFEKSPQISAGFDEHRSFSELQAQELEACLQRLDADPSMLKDSAMKLAGLMQPFLTAMSADEHVKHLLAAHAYTHFEVASYHSLAAASQQIGETGIAEVCQRFMEKERAFADWIDQQIPEISRQYINR